MRIRTGTPLSTTIVVAAQGPKLPPYTGDSTAGPGGTARRRSRLPIVNQGAPLATTAVAAALGPKLPPFQGE
jgi:hypothetical protein